MNLYKVNFSYKGEGDKTRCIGINKIVLSTTVKHAIEVVESYYDNVITHSVEYVNAEILLPKENT